MKKYVKKPIPVSAIQYDGRNHEEIIEFCGGGGHAFKNPHHTAVIIKNKSGDSIAAKGDWVICGVMGEFYACPSEVFESAYQEFNDHD